jgi:hypothetical protein
MVRILLTSAALGLLVGAMSLGAQPGRPEQTLEAIQAEAAADPESVLLWTKLADAQLNKGEKAAAIVSLHAVMDRVPLEQRSGEEALKLGHGLVRADRPEEAAPNLRRAVAKMADRKELDAYHMAGLLASVAMCGDAMKDDLPAAEALVAAKTAGRPEKLNVYAIASQVAFHAKNAAIGELFEARADAVVEEELKAAKPDAAAVVRYAEIASGRSVRRRGKSRSLLHRLHEKCPEVAGDYRFNMLWGRIHANKEEAGDFNMAVGSYRKAMTLAEAGSDEHDAARYGVYTSLMALGRFDEALQEATAGRDEAVNQRQRDAWQAVVDQHAAKAGQVDHGLAVRQAGLRVHRLQALTRAAHERARRLDRAGEQVAAAEALAEYQRLEQALAAATVDYANLRLAATEDAAEADKLRHQIYAKLCAQGKFDEALAAAESALAAASNEELKAPWRKILAAHETEQRIVAVTEQVRVLQAQAREANARYLALRDAEDAGAAEALKTFEEIQGQLDAAKAELKRLQDALAAAE